MWHGEELAGVGCGEADVYNGEPREVLVAEWDEFCLRECKWGEGGVDEVWADYYRPISKYHFVLPKRHASWTDLRKSLRKATHELFGVVINLVGVRWACTAKTRRNGRKP